MSHHVKKKEEEYCLSQSRFLIFTIFVIVSKFNDVDIHMHIYNHSYECDSLECENFVCIYIIGNQGSENLTIFCKAAKGQS